MTAISVIAECAELVDGAKQLARRFALPFGPTKQPGLQLILTARGLVLRDRQQTKLGDVWVDWASGAVAHRRNFGGGRGQAVAKAVGLKKGQTPTVLDATAGLGRDGMVLASLGCSVTLVERHPAVAALLYDGYQRACLDADIGPWVAERVQCHHGQSRQMIETLPQHDVIYLDPMFPHRAKSAQVKKEMRLFQQLVGADEDADELLAVARQHAAKRVVVKRPDYADFMAGQQPHHQIVTKKNRFDVYMATS
ncbi:class I SAM-dependent methyltransferase [Neiella sp. HB171785]|uniref:Ribosomal RNA small subunit methyltransferase J n=1 Tax=Neiella litorisoli TaxID=2771431 RepID=A0A8J6UEZ1_9GAMM|nr:class I SAM-dependent methyltransferase [Neiella litorisoli]MBD1390224.1 class I SAM-dependent methyltransferase [Neiella litorisoli]